MAVIYKDIDLLSQKSSVAGTEKLPVSDTEYITPSQISTKVASDLDSANIAYIGDQQGTATYVSGGSVIDVTTKADKVSTPTTGNFAALDSSGNLTDSGHKHSDYITSHQDISGKADKVTSATNGNFASLDSNGNLADSGHKHSDYLTSETPLSKGTTTGNGNAVTDLSVSGHTITLTKGTTFLTSHQDISGKADKVTSATNGNFAGLDSNGNLTDSGKKASDFQVALVSGTNIKTINNESILGSGNISVSGGGGSTADCVHITGDETIAGDKTFTDDIIVGNASNIKYGASSGSGFTRGNTSSTLTSAANSITFTSLSGEPKAFFVSIASSLTDLSNAAVIGVIGDSSTHNGCYTSGTQHNYSSSFSSSYSGSSLTVTAPTGVNFAAMQYNIVYYYGTGTLSFRTATASPGSGATTVTFTDTNLTAVPAFYALQLETQVSNESYRRVAYYTNEAGGSSATALGVSFYSSQIHNTTTNFSVSYTTGLLVNSGGTNAGGYFHNPGTYKLYYLMASDIGGGGGGSYASLDAELSAMNTSISGKEATSNKVTSVSAQSTDTQYPSAKLLYDQLALKQGTITVSTSEPTAYQGNNGDIWFVVSS